MEKSYTLKSTPQDFVVEEIADMNLSKLSDQGIYAYVEVRKEGLNTAQAAHILSEAFNLDEGFIKYAGLKDKHAVTTQLFSLQHAKRKAIEEFKHPQVRLRLLGYGDEPVYVGSHESNKFTIRVQFNTPEAKTRFERGAARLQKQPLLLNYFDEQRFSTQNVQLGLMLMKKQFTQACDLLKESEQNNAFHAFYGQNPTNPVGALKTMPKTTLSIYLHAVQSAIFNHALASFVRKRGPAYEVAYSQGALAFPDEASFLHDVAAPLAGFGMAADARFDAAIQEEFMKFGIGERDFILRQFPEISCEGATRKASVPIKGFHAEEISDQGALVTFILPKGSYATMVFKQLFYE